MKKIFCFIVLFNLLCFGQELLADVMIDFQNLPVINKESLRDFEATIEDYLNNTRFTGGDWNYEKIKCSFNISIVSAGDEVSYSAQAVITSQRKLYKSTQASLMLKIFDTNWDFIYERGQSLYFDPLNFNSIASFFDYYAFVIIGMENDSWEKLSGTDFFRKAFDIVNLGVRSKNSKGWEALSGNFNRKDLVENMLNEKYRPLREAVADYHYALDVSVKNKNAAMQQIVQVVKNLEKIKGQMDIRSVYLRTFFEAKYGEIIEMLRGVEDKSIFKVLKALDPQHAGKYDEVLQKTQ